MKAITSSRVLINGKLQRAWVLFEAGKVSAVETSIPSVETKDFGDAVVSPGFVDTHVHVNEPGHTDWEGFETATKAAIAGGVTTLVDMPLNCLPVTNSKAALETKRKELSGKLWADLGYWGGVTGDSLDHTESLLDAGVLGVKSFLIDSGLPEFQPVNFEQAEIAMGYLAARGLAYLFHAEVEVSKEPELDSNSYVEFERSRPKKWEDEAISKLIELSEKTRCHVHIVHLSSSNSLEAIKRAKEKGIKITIETCPHYLLHTAAEIDKNLSVEIKSLLKCCPPIRDRQNREELWAALKSGLIDLVVSDHSPCTAGLKNADLDQAWGGVSSLQLTLPLFWTHARERGFSIEQCLGLITKKPAGLAGIANIKGEIKTGADADFSIFDPDLEFEVKRENILTKNKLTPYLGQTLFGSVSSVYLRGECVYESGRVTSVAQGKEILK